MFEFLSSRMARRFKSGTGPRVAGFGSHGTALGFVPLAAGDGSAAFDPVFLICGLAVLSAGLVVLHAAHTLRPQAARVTSTSPQLKHLYTAEEALAERGRRAGETDVLVDALAGAAAAFYAIAGQLPIDASERVVRRADDLRELVWMNRAG